MSILLDALRKTERQQRQGTLPDIHAEDLATEHGRAEGSRAWLLWVLAVIILVVLIAYGWQAWQARQVPTAPPEYTDEPAKETTSDAAATPGSQGAPSPAAGTPPPSAATTPNPAPRLDRQPRSPVETLDSDQPLQSAAKPNPPPAREPGRPGQADTASQTSATSSPAASDALTETQRRRAAQIAALREAVETTGVAEEAPEPSPRGARPAEEPDDDAISFWQLPEMTRNALPELRINVMVYDEDPAKRFIIMGGKRYSEGTEVSADLELEAVRRDRALFRYGAYLFYVKQ